MNIYKTNLNLLKTFLVVAQECHVSRAAKRLHITQPALSNSLNQLRALLKDKILVHGNKGMVLTQKARKLLPKVELALREMETLLFYSDQFDYKTAQRTFTLGMSDYVEFVLLPVLFKQIQKIAPNIALRIVSGDSFSAEKFEQGEIELGIGVQLKEVKQLNTEKLFSDSAVCVAHQTHPIFKCPLTVDRYLKAEHLAIKQKAQESSITDTVLGKNKLVRKSKVMLPDILPSLQILSVTQLVGTLPKRIIEPVAKIYKLKYVKMPMTVPEVTIVQYWHLQHENDAGLIWLREVIKEVCAKYFV